MYIRVVYEAFFLLLVHIYKHDECWRL